MTPFQPDQIAAVRSLAIRYAAYTDALSKDDPLAIRVWSDALLSAQKDAGVALVSEDLLTELSRYYPKGEAA